VLQRLLIRDFGSPAGALFADSSSSNFLKMRDCRGRLGSKDQKWIESGGKFFRRGTNVHSKQHKKQRDDNFGHQSYVSVNGGPYSQWYIGIAAAPRQRLFNDHCVTENGGAWIYRECSTSSAAREIEEYFIQLGMQGGPGGGDATTKYVYAYKITQTTRE
jgi:hypothetical protein